MFFEVRAGVSTSHAISPLPSPFQKRLATSAGTRFVSLGLTCPFLRSDTLMYGTSPTRKSADGDPCPPRVASMPLAQSSPSVTTEQEGSREATQSLAARAADVSQYWGTPMRELASEEAAT